MKGKVGKIIARLELNGVDWSAAARLFADNTMQLAESERELLSIYSIYIIYSVCHRVSGKGYEKKEYVHGDKERPKEQYPLVDFDIWIRHMEQGTAIMSVYYGNDVP